jgi:hypothetical protein
MNDAYFYGISRTECKLGGTVYWTGVYTTTEHSGGKSEGGALIA